MEARLVTVALALSALAGCGGLLPTLPLGPLTPYRIDVQQGNVVTQEMMAKVQPGMSRSQVRFALGTPLIADPFHPDRWDYVYVLHKKGQLVAQRRIVAVFKDDKLVSIEGDVVPAREGEAKTEGAVGSAQGAAAATKEAAPKDTGAATKDAAAIAK